MNRCVNWGGFKEFDCYARATAEYLTILIALCKAGKKRDMVLASKNFNVPNAISVCRLASVPIMLWCTFTGREHLFTWLLLGALLSDIADGVIARVFHLETKLGATLDAMADMGTYISAVAGIFLFQFTFIKNHSFGIGVILLFYIVEKMKTFFHYQKPFNAFHTYLSKLTAYVQGIFVMSLFLFGYHWYLFYPAIAISIAANIEEMILTSLLPKYESDVKGLYWVLQRRRSDS
jgi:cardiolipin synthase (CMP-forming)